MSEQHVAEPAHVEKLLAKGLPERTVASGVRPRGMRERGPTREQRDGGTRGAIARAIRGRGRPEVTASTAAAPRTNATALGCSQNSAAAVAARSTAREREGAPNSRSKSATAAMATGTETTKLKNPM